MQGYWAGGPGPYGLIIYFIPQKDQVYADSLFLDIKQKNF